MKWRVASDFRSFRVRRTREIGRYQDSPINYHPTDTSVFYASIYTCVSRSTGDTATRRLRVWSNAVDIKQGSDVRHGRSGQWCDTWLGHSPPIPLWNWTRRSPLIGKMPSDILTAYPSHPYVNIVCPNLKKCVTHCIMSLIVCCSRVTSFERRNISEMW